jgi:hypothetical protein
MSGRNSDKPRLAQRNLARLALAEFLHRKSA